MGNENTLFYTFPYHRKCHNFILKYIGLFIMYCNAYFLMISVSCELHRYFSCQQIHWQTTNRPFFLVDANKLVRSKSDWLKSLIAKIIRDFIGWQVTFVMNIHNKMNNVKGHQLHINTADMMCLTYAGWTEMLSEWFFRCCLHSFYWCKKVIS